jgi:hypothetical protein
MSAVVAFHRAVPAHRGGWTARACHAGQAAPDTIRPATVTTLVVASTSPGRSRRSPRWLADSASESAKQRVPDAPGAPAVGKAATKKCPDRVETVLADAKVRNTTW